METLYNKVQRPFDHHSTVAGVLSIAISFYEYHGLHEGTEVFFEPVGIFIAILLATGMAFFFEEKANRAFAILNQVDDDEPVEVIRDGNPKKIAKRDIVVDDIVLLNTGAEVPADGKLLEAISLHIDESTLTGEPICHKSTHEEDFDKDATFLLITCCEEPKLWKDTVFSVWKGR